MNLTDWSLSPKKALAAFPRIPSSAVRFLEYAIGLLGFLGFLDATYLTILHYKNAIPPCTLHGCETVLTSSFATIGGVPIALIGAGYYLVVLVLVGFLLSYSSSEEHSDESRSKSNSSRFTTFARTITTLLVLLTGTGLLIGLFLVFIQAFILHAFCQYCLASEIIDFLLFDCAWWLWRWNG